MHYTKGSMIFDLLACVPFGLIVWNASTYTKRMFMLFKLLRVYRLG